MCTEIKLVVKICTYVKKKNYFAFIQKVRPEVFCIKHVRKHFRGSRPVCLRPATLLKMRLWHRCFPVNFVKFLRTPYFTEHAWTTASGICYKTFAKVIKNEKYV